MSVVPAALAATGAREDDVAHVVLLRHGQSTWNNLNVFTGWTDVELTEEGAFQARRAGGILRALGWTFDLAFTSVLRRAVRTLSLVLDELELMHILDVKSWRLNERHYGGLQGLNKAQTAKTYGAEQVHQWRRGFATRPPLLPPSDPRHPAHDERYHLTGDMAPGDLPAGESLAECVARTLPFWHDVVVPAVRAGRRVLVAAHGNSLRGIVKHLDGISDDDIMSVEIPVGTPLVYTLDRATLRPLRSAYLGEPQAVSSTSPVVGIGPGGERLVEPSSWGLLTPSGPPLTAWLADLKRVGLIRSPVGIMQLQKLDGGASTEGATSVRSVKDGTTASEAATGGQAQDATAAGVPVPTAGVAQAPAGPPDTPAAGAAAVGTGGTRPASAALELLDNATLPCGDLQSILPHCRFLAVDIGALRPAPSAHTVVLSAGPDDPTVSMLLIVMLAAVGPALDPAQHVLLLVDGAAQAAVVRVDGTAAPLPNTSLRLLREAVAEHVRPGVRVLHVALPLPREAPGDMELRAAQVSALTGLQSSGPAALAPPAGLGSASAVDAMSVGEAGGVPAPAASDAVPNALLPASRVAVLGAEVAALSGAVGPAELKRVELMLQYTGRTTAVMLMD